MMTDYEMEFAKEAGPMAVAELLNKREAEQKAKAAVAAQVVEIKPIAVVSVDEALMVWALYEDGHLTSGQTPVLPSDGGSNWPRRSADDWTHASSDMMRVAKAVERVRGFQQARQALRDVHCQPPLALSALSPGQRTVYEQFRSDLAARLARRPITYTFSPRPRIDVAELSERLRKKREEDAAIKRAKRARVAS